MEDGTELEEVKIRLRELELQREFIGREIQGLKDTVDLKDHLDEMVREVNGAVDNFADEFENAIMKAPIDDKASCGSSPNGILFDTVQEFIVKEFILD